jgi:nicotinate-nucleotide adenylyltransferase
MDNKELQKIVDDTFKENFGYTPLKERIDDIFGEALELHRFTDISNLKEEAGDLLSSLIQLCNESGWDFSELVNYTCNEKINRRTQQYKSLGRKYKIALLGGAFNPITTGHVEVAKYVLNTSKQFDEVWIIPAYNHMHNKQMEPFEKRVEMCKLATKDDPRIKVFEYEKEKNLAGETYHLMKTLMNDKEYMDKYNFSFIIGLDNANSFDKWINYEELENMVRFVIVPRKGYDIVPGSWYFNNPHIFLNGSEENVHIMEISSTEVRSLIDRYRNMHSDNAAAKTKNEISNSMHEDVFNYIMKNNLYNED